MTPAAVVSVGVYDGVHRGHAAVLGRAAVLARRSGARTVVFTFDAHPEGVLSGGDAPPELTPVAEREPLLCEAGADEVQVVSFSQVAGMTPQAFLRVHVFPRYRMGNRVVGYDFALGKDRLGTVEVLDRLGRGLGFAVEAVPSLDVGGAPVSSSRVREALAGGRVREAAAMLGRPYLIAGRVVPGEGRGRSLGFPTANLDLPPGKMRPARGVYAVRVFGPGVTGAAGVVNVGCRPTFGGGRETVEVHVLDVSGDWVGKELRMDLVERIRPERRFRDAAELAARIERDASRARSLLSVPAPADNSS